MITFSHCDALVRQMGGFLAVCNQHNPVAHNHWGSLQEDDAGREELRRRIRVLFAVPSDLLRSDERGAMIREYAEANLK
jgi:hypothetical protein